LKTALAEEIEIYKNLIVTEENLQASKKDLAALRKIRTQIDDRKKAVKKAFIEPYTKFENEVKEAFAILDEPINHIDKQVKEFEEQRKSEKKEHCREVYSAAVGDMADFIPFERIFNEKWLNVTSTDKDITDVVESEIIRVKNDLNAIHALGSEIESECVEAYKIAGTLTAAIQRNSDYLKAKSNVTEDKPTLGYVTFKVLASDADRVADMLDFAEIKYERR
jgi:hypothetical protein